MIRGTETTLRASETINRCGWLSTLTTYVSAFPSPAYHQRQNRPWIFSAPPALRFGNACVNSEQSVATEESSRNRVCFQALLRKQSNGQSPQELPVMCMKDLITAPRFASNGYGSTPMMAQKRLSMCVIGTADLSRSNEFHRPSVRRSWSGNT
jgi:hypothetical protein